MDYLLKELIFIWVILLAYQNVQTDILPTRHQMYVIHVMDLALLVQVQAVVSVYPAFRGTMTQQRNNAKQIVQLDFILPIISVTPAQVFVSVVILLFFVLSAK